MDGKWQTVKRPGYFGRQRDQCLREYDEQFGVANWRIAWQIGEGVGPMAEVVMLYEGAYYVYLASHPDVTHDLTTLAHDVFDDEMSNVSSGLDYTIQETAHTHLQDIAIRRCLVRLGLRFRGERLIQIRDIRGDHFLSLKLSPGQVPFHRLDLICQPELDGWWNHGSVESFYQSNKLLQVLLAA